MFEQWFGSLKKNHPELKKKFPLIFGTFIKSSRCFIRADQVNICFYRVRCSSMFIWEFFFLVKNFPNEISLFGTKWNKSVDLGDAAGLVFFFVSFCLCFNNFFFDMKAVVCFAEMLPLIMVLTSRKMLTEMKICTKWKKREFRVFFSSL